MKKSIYILILTLIFSSGKILAQCDGILTANISGGTSPICFDASPGTLTATGSGVSGPFSYLWYKNDISTGIITQTYNPGNLTATSTFHCEISTILCTAVKSNVITITVVNYPSAPLVGTPVQPTCTVSTGSVQLSGLPTVGDWTIIISPGGATWNGNGATTTITGLVAATSYTFKVRNYGGCESPSSLPAEINAQPVTPSAPVIGNITQPTCILATGSVVLNSLPSTGTWVLTRNPGNVTTSGSGTSYTVSDLDPVTYTFRVTNQALCTSPQSSSVVINAQPPSPPAPVYTIDCTLGFNHAVITITAPVGAGYQYSLDGGAFQPGTSFAEVSNGNHLIAVRNTEGCITLGNSFAVSCGCIFIPTLVLSAETGNTCGTTPVTVAGNTFSNATSVTITENGAGSVDQPSITLSPFSFTYTPAAGDRNRIVIITVTTDNPLGAPCSPAIATYTLAVNGIPASPSVGTITHLSCTILTGSVVLNGLPSSGTWTLTRSPDNVITSGTGTSTTVTGLSAGTYTFIVTTEEGCISDASAPVVINPQPESPTTPIIGTITHPTCTVSTGTVELSGLPASGTWILTRLPGGFTRTGTGSNYTVDNVPSGTFTYTVTNAAQCVSPPSESFVVNPRPVTPSPPSIGTITAPSCTLSTGSVILLGLPATGTWEVTRFPGTVRTTGTGISDTITGLPAGSTYNFTVKNADGCTSLSSANVVIPAQPARPTPPVVGTITQPTYTVPTGSVVLSGLPSAGSWILTRLPDQVTTAGTNRTFTVTGLAGGLYHFTVTNSIGCVSDSSAEVRISTPGPPEVIITDPPAVCAPSKVDLTAPAVTEGSTGGLVYTYWTDEEATLAYATPTSADEGTYYIKGTTVSGFFTIKPVNAAIDEMPVANAGPDQSLSFQFSTTMEAELGENETGGWIIESGTGVFADTTDPAGVVNNLSSGNNIMAWIVTRGVCPADTDKVTVNVGDVTIPTLITPNGDTKNEYFVILGLSNLGESELIIFDRRGAEVFRNPEYDNKWNGVDYNENPLPNDTYFFVLSSAEGRTFKGYIVIRR